MYIYYIVLVILVIAYLATSTNYDSNIHNPGAKRFSWISGICFVAIIGLRATSVGSDTIEYFYRYDYYFSGGKVDFDKYEVGYEIIEYFFGGVLGIGYNGFLFFVALFSVSTLIYIIYKYSKNELLSIMLFLILLFSMFMSGIRQTIAISICLWAFECAFNRKLLIYGLLLALAYTIHNSSIIFIPAYFMCNIRISKIQAAIAFVIALCAVFYRPYLTPIIEFLSPEKYNNVYIVGGADTYAINPLVVAVTVLLLLFSLICLSVSPNEKGKMVLKPTTSSFFLFSCIFLMMQILSVSNGQIMRLGLYYAIGEILVVPDAVSSARLTKETSKIVSVVISTLCVLYFLVSVPGDVMELDNYLFFWQSN